MTEKREQPEECDSCGYATPTLKLYPRAFTQPPMWLCRLCASTPAGNAYDYPGQYQGQSAVLKTICYVGNAILAELKR